MPYAYLIGSLFMLCLWITFYFLRKDLRKEMIIISIISAVCGIMLSTFVWTKDWWLPPTISNLGLLEDLIFGFATGGVITAIHSVIFKEKITQGLTRNNLGLAILIIISTVIGVIGSLVLHLPSWFVWLLSTAVTCIVGFILRKDLAKYAVETGALCILIGLVFYLLMYLIDPTMFSTWYFHNNLTGINIYGLPIEEIIWWFTSGMLLAPAYKFWMNAKIVKERSD